MCYFQVTFIRRSYLFQNSYLQKIKLLNKYLQIASYKPEDHDFYIQKTVLCGQGDTELHCLLHKLLPKPCDAESLLFCTLTSR